MSDPQIELNNRSYAWIAGLVAFLIMCFLAAFFVGTGEKVPLSTVYGSAGSEIASGTLDDVDGNSEDTFGFDADATDTVGGDGVGDGVDTDTIIPTAAPTTGPTPFPTLVPTTLPTAAPTATLVPAVTDAEEPAESATGEEDQEQPTEDTPTDDADTGTDEGPGAAFPTPGPDGVVEPTPVPTRTGPGLFRVQDIEAEGATIEENSVVVKINDNGTGTAVGDLNISWPDGTELSLSFDDSFEYSTAYEDISVGLDATYSFDSPNDDEDEDDQRGTMRIPNPDLRIGAICVASCFTFDY